MLKRAQEHGVILRSMGGAIPEVVKKAQEHKIALEAIQRAIPASVRYAWNPDHKPVFFITALDQRLELPYELCYQWKVCNQYPSLERVRIRSVALKHNFIILDIS